jgi:hypothetical protein
MTNSNNIIPKWKLEWYLIGALPADESARIAALERSDGELRGRIAALRESNAAILAEYPPVVMAGRARQCAFAADVPGGVRASARDSQGWGFVRHWTVPAFACAALLAVLPVYMVMTGAQEPAAAVYATRTKGAAEAAPPSLEVWRKAGEGAEKLNPEAAVSAGDIVQLRYTVPDSCYGALVSMDGRGVLTVHLSGGDGKAAALTPGRPVALKTSYKLDDAPAFEAFYLITARDNFDLESIRRKLLAAKHPIGDGRSLPLVEKQMLAFTLIKSDGGR